MKPKGKRPSSLWMLIVVLVVAVIAALCIWEDSKATVVNKPYKWDGDLQAVRWVSRVQNGVNFSPVDSGVETSFPADISITLNDTANWTVLIGALWTGESDTLWTTEHLPLKDWKSSFDEVLASIDSVNFWLGFCPTCHSVKGRSGDRDTLHIMKGADSLLHVLYWHLGGVTGNTPDSVTIR